MYVRLYRYSFDVDEKMFSWLLKGDGRCITTITVVICTAKACRGNYLALST